MLDDILARLTSSEAGIKKELKASALAATSAMKWMPNPGPQTEAYFSKADCLLYGGEPGGGKSQLILGLAFNEHKRSLIMRREYGDLDRLIEDALKIHGSRDGFNGSPPPRLRISEDQVINFRAAHRVGDEQGTMGQGRDLLGIDEATHFAESQIRFLMGWVRTDIPGQRCRTVLATNPPLSAEGLWVTTMFAPWLDPKYPNPAQPGELRWVCSDEDGKDFWVSGPDETIEVRGKTIRPTSRSYIPSSVKDNPYYAGTDYERTLDAMSEPWRSMLMGGFQTEFKDHTYQVIYTDWVRAAMARWDKRPPDGVGMSALGIDPALGGDDSTVFARRHGHWYDELVTVPGKQTSDPIETAGHAIALMRDSCTLVVDVIGIGSGCFSHLKQHVRGVDVVGLNVAEASGKRSRDGKYKFANKRSEMWWKFREALEPNLGEPIALPNDRELLADLTAPTFKLTSAGIVIESKDDIRKRLGRSTDKADAVIMAWAYGEDSVSARIRVARNPTGAPRVNLGHANMKVRRR
ncbi:MAG: terminase [Mesorhizobium sp.]|nr:terminase [Mesorhizobium sp.]MCO5159632.1 terminase [Mesorhizobium sp.]